jgi:hypothetical protein
MASPLPPPMTAQQQMLCNSDMITLSNHLTTLSNQRQDALVTLRHVPKIAAYRSPALKRELVESAPILDVSLSEYPSDP